MPIRLFWWSPLRHPRHLYPELVGNGVGWLRQSRRTCRPFQNFGDELSPLVVEALTGCRVVWAPPSRADLFAMGSILDFYISGGSRGLVWGSGLRGESGASCIPDLSQAQIIAVRGPNTLSKLGKPAGSVVIGDPGVLVTRLVRGRTSHRAGGKLLLPHFRWWGSQSGQGVIREYAKRGFAVVSPSMSPRRLVSRIRDADLLVTSSLHGIVVAHAMGTPVQQVSIADAAVGEPGFKYDDYFASISLAGSCVDADTLKDDRRWRSLVDNRSHEVADAASATARLAAQLDACAPGKL